MTTAAQLLRLAAPRRRRRRQRRPRFPGAAEIRYRRELNALMRRVGEVVREVMPQVLPLIESASRPDLVVDRVMADLRSRVAALAGPAQVNAVVSQAAVEVDRVAATEIRENVERASGLPVALAMTPVPAPVRTPVRMDQGPDLDAIIQAFIRDNVRLITNVPDTLLNEIEGILLRGARQGTTIDVMAEQVRERAGIAARRAQFIVRNELGSLYSEVTRHRQTALGIEEYVWRTSRDSRVRPSHREREGKTFRWDNPPPGGHPGADFNCRCTAQPVIPDDVL